MSAQATIKILFLTANPQDTTRLQIDEEMRAVDLALRMTEYRDRFDLRLHGAVRYGDLQELLLRYQPHIVHFSGHGSPAGEIILQSEHGIHPVSAEALSTLFSILKDNLRCVVLNACYSEVQAQAIADHIDCVIGMTDTIGDMASINFAVAFYRALGYGRSVKAAFDLGCNEINLANLPDNVILQLLAPHRDPTQVVFVNSGTSGKSSLVGTELVPTLPAQSSSHLSHNLPLLRDLFIGREEEVAAVQHLLLRSTVGLVTLTGPGGVGKTRLALEVSANLLDHFDDGVYFVALVALDDPSLLISTIAQTLSIPETEGQELRQSLHDVLRDKHMLLVLDNFEHLLEGVTVVADILRWAPNMTMLVTSREQLNLQGEWVFNVRGLDIPLSSEEAECVKNCETRKAEKLTSKRTTTRNAV